MSGVESAPHMVTIDLYREGVIRRTTLTPVAQVLCQLLETHRETVGHQAELVFDMLKHIRKEVYEVPLCEVTRLLACAVLPSARRCLIVAADQGAAPTSLVPASRPDP